ncbi:MAG: LuxR family transcriptional regulator [Suilimivivens sp.]
MEKKKLDSSKISVIITLAIWNFVFLGTEYLFDNMMAYVTDAQEVVIAQSRILGASVIGFFLYPLFKRQQKAGIKNILLFAASFISVICIFLIQQRLSYQSIMVAGCLIFVLFGMAGGVIHKRAADLFAPDKNLAKAIGVSYALGLALQFLNNNLVRKDVAEAIVLALFTAAGAIMMTGFDGEENSGQESEIRGNIVNGRRITGKPEIAGVILLANVILMSCIFATLDNAVTLVHAEGAVDIGQWPRLLLAVSGLLAGVLFDLKDRRFMDIGMYCVTLLSTICVVVIELGGPFLAGLIVFYLSAGFFVIYFTTGFVELAGCMKLPELWAGLGRTANNFCAVMIGPVSVAMLSSGNGMMISVTALVLFALISITMFLYSGRVKTDFTQEESKKQSVGEKQERDIRKFNAFAKQFSLTEREQEVMKLLLTSDENVQDLAGKLYISRAALYRHLTSLNEKTDTRSRIGLLQFYYSFKETD